MFFFALPLLYSDILYIQAAHHVHSLAMDQARWTAATTYGEIALTGYKKYYGERHGLVAALLVRLDPFSFSKPHGTRNLRASII